MDRCRWIDGYGRIDRPEDRSRPGFKLLLMMMLMLMLVALLLLYYSRADAADAADAVLSSS